MSQIQPNMTLPASIQEKLKSVRNRTLQVRIGTALLVALGVLLAAMGVAMLVDWLATLYDSRWRGVLTYSAFTAAGAALVASLLAAWRHTRQIDQIAAGVDQEIPQLEERWSTLAQLSAPHAASSASPIVHPAMYRKVAQEASRWSPRVDAKAVVPLDRLLRALVGLTAIAVVLAGAALLDSQRAAVLFRRFWAPNSSISATMLTEVAAPTVVGRGESLEISAQINGKPVDQAALLLNPAEGELQTISLVPRGDDPPRVLHRLRSVDAPLKYRLRAGDGQTAWQEIMVADRPQLSEMRMTLTPPPYTRQQSKVVTKLPRRITALEGTVLQLALKPKAPIQSARLKILGGKTASGRDAAQLRNLEFQRDSEGWYRWEQVLTGSFSFSPILTESHGLESRRTPKCEMRVLPDKPPVVKILSPGKALAVRPDDTVPITFLAKDDVGIGSAELVVYDESQFDGGKLVPLVTIPVPLEGQQGAKEVKVTVDLDLSQFEMDDGAEVSFAIRVREDRAKAEFGSDKAPEDPTDSAFLTSALQPEDSASQSSDSFAGLPPSPAPADPGEREPVESSPELPREARAQAGPSEGDETKALADAEPVADNDARAEPEQPAASDSESPAKSSEQRPSVTQQFSTPKNSNQAAKPPSEGNPPPSSPPNSPPRNQRALQQLDLPPPQSTASRRMRLRIDEWAGSFAGQQRLQLELAIAPRLEELDQSLAKAEHLARNVLEDLLVTEKWQSKYDRDLGSAEQHLVEAIKLIDAVERRSRGTPYAFVGLQLLDIGQAHVVPARRDFWKSLQTKAKPREVAMRNGLQHTGRARELLALLTVRFERARREYALAESVERIKKMYQVFVEDSMALLRGEGSEGSPYSRKMAEFELDEEYLARLKEVLEMRNAMRAELARILAEDPRLLRRYLDAQRNRSRILRHELEELEIRQFELNRESKAWVLAEEAERPQLAEVMLRRHLMSVEDVAVAAAELHDRFETWLPLARAKQDADLKATIHMLQDISTSTSELTAAAVRFTSLTVRTKEPHEEEASEEEAEAKKAAEDSAGVEAILEGTRHLYDQLIRLEVLLRQVGLREGEADLSMFALNRLLETRRLIAQTSAWIRQLKQQQAGNYHRAAEVEQYRLAMETDSMAGKLANLEQQLANLMQTEDGTLPEAVADEARKLLATLDEQAAPNQLAAVNALRRNQMPRARDRQDSAYEALVAAGKQYDKMIELAIKELDKLPVDDPIASLLRDPTLDELLAGLEQEVPLRELLGIPNRPTNLSIVSDWLNSASDNGLTTGSRAWVMNQFRQQQQLRQRQLDRAYRRALARALQETDAANLVDAMPTQRARPTADWNVLLSQLGDDLNQGRDKAPPERYRRAIEQYFRQISESKDGESTQPE